jgi:hypothetical protein
MPSRVCSHNCYRVLTCMYREAPSFRSCTVHMSVIMPTCVCILERDHAHTCVYVHTSTMFPHVYVRICVIMPTRRHCLLVCFCVCRCCNSMCVSTHQHDHVHPCTYAHIGAIMPTFLCTQKRDHAHTCMYAHTTVIMPIRVCMCT